jgi:glycosyltransferase involved in cell wall biosynthesis
LLLLNYQIPHYQMASLYRRANCVLLPSRGEGWNMPAVEAMACGTPVIGTAWGAQLDYMTPNNSLLLQTRGCVPAVAKCPYYEGFEWADPDPEHLRDLIRFAIDHPNELRQTGQRASEDIHSRYSWQRCAERILDRIKTVFA